MKKMLFVFFFLSPLLVCGKKVDTVSAIVRLETTMGDIRIKLHDATPMHRDNFLKLCAEHFYDSLMFHRVIRSFMIQAGDPDSRHAKPYELLGDGGPGYDIPAEIVYPRFLHQRGVVAAARESDEENPERRSSGSQFYIVVGNAKHLDGAYTIFGEVIEGIDNVLEIQRQDTDDNDRPLQDIRILKTVIERMPTTP